MEMRRLTLAYSEIQDNSSPQNSCHIVIDMSVYV